MSYVERAKQAALDKEELKAFRARQSDDTMAAIANSAALDERARNQAVIDSLIRDRSRTPYSPYTGIGSNEFLQETKYIPSEVAMDNLYSSFMGQPSGLPTNEQFNVPVRNEFEEVSSPKFEEAARERFIMEQQNNLKAQEAEQQLAAREYANQQINEGNQ